MNTLPHLPLEEALRLVEGTKAFRAHRLDGMVLVGYLYHDLEVFRSHPLARELRGAVWEEADGALLSRPFHKFYNLGEPLAPEGRGPMEGVLVAPKVDGFMVQSFLRRGRVVRASRHSLSMGLIRPYLEAYWTHEHEALTARASSALGGATLLWELVHPEAPVLQRGQTPGLHLLAARTLSGEYLVPLAPEAQGSPVDLERAVGPLPQGLLAVRWHPAEAVFGRGATWEGALEAVRSGTLKWESLEGAVALRPEGELVKLKTPWAFRLAAFLMDPLGKILEAIAEDRADDLMAFLRRGREDLAAWVEVALAEVGALVRAGMELGEAWRGRERRAFWEAVVATFPHPHQHLAQKAAARAYEGRPPEAIWEEARALLRRGNVAKALASHLEEVLAGRGYRAVRERAKELG